MSRELMPKSGIMMPHVVVNRDAAVVGVSTVDGVAGAVDLTGKYLQKTDAADIYQTKTEGASKTYVLDSIQPIMEGALFKADPFVDNNTPFRSAGANGVESVDMIKVTPENSIKLGSYESSVQGVEIHSAGRVVVVDKNDSGVETKYPVYSKRFRPEIEDLPFAAIGSYVKDSKGRTIGVNRTGINSDIKQFTQKVTFQQPVTIADGVGDYDAVTMRQLRNSGGGGGPTMNGISNFNIGDFRLVDSRAFIQANDVVSDGQLLNRADYPELWAYAQLLTPISDADWLSSPEKRGKYSLGNGTTTFRVPDRNGVQSSSVSGLFGRGDGGASANNGLVYPSGAPNITGSSEASLITGFSTGAPSRGSGVFVPTDVVASSTKWATTGTGVTYLGSLSLDASRSNAIYGRTVSEIRPNSFIGVWVIRAKGAFIAANTLWSVINGDQEQPPPGVYVSGGTIRSEYTVAGERSSSAALRVLQNDGIANGVLTVSSRVNNKTNEWFFKDDGTVSSSSGIFNVEGIIRSNNSIEASGPFYSQNTGYPGIQLRSNRYNNPNTNVGAITVLESSGTDGSTSSVNLIRRRGDGTSTGQIAISFPTTAGTLALQGTSGLEYKKDIKDASPKEAFDRISNQRLVNFIYKDDEQERVRFGVIAEEAEIIAPQYIKHHEAIESEIFDDDGNKTGEVLKDRPSVDVNPIVMDLIGAVHYLRDEVEQLKAELAELKASK